MAERITFSKAQLLQIRGDMMEIECPTDFQKYPINVFSTDKNPGRRAGQYGQDESVQKAIGRGDWRQKDSDNTKRRQADKKYSESPVENISRSKRGKAVDGHKKGTSRSETRPFTEAKSRSSKKTETWDFPSADDMAGDGKGMSLMAQFERERLAMRASTTDAETSAPIARFGQESDNVMQQLLLSSTAQLAPKVAGAADGAGRHTGGRNTVTGAEWSGGSPPGCSGAGRGAQNSIEPASPQGFGGGLLGEMPGFDRSHYKPANLDMDDAGIRSLTASELMHNAAAHHQHKSELPSDLHWFGDVMSSPARHHDDDYYAFQHFLDPSSPERHDTSSSYSMAGQAHSTQDGGGGAGRSSSKSSRLSSLLGIVHATPNLSNSSCKDPLANCSTGLSVDSSTAGIRELSLDDRPSGLSLVTDSSSASPPFSSPPQYTLPMDSHNRTSSGPAEGSGKGLGPGVKKVSVNSLFAFASTSPDSTAHRSAFGPADAGANGVPSGERVLTAEEAVASFAESSPVSPLQYHKQAGQTPPRYIPPTTSVLSSLGFSPERDSPLAPHTNTPAATSNSSTFVFHNSPAGSTPASAAANSPSPHSTPPNRARPDGASSSPASGLSASSFAGKGSASKGHPKMSAASRIQLQKLANKSQAGSGTRMTKVDVSALFGQKQTATVPTSTPTTTTTDNRGSPNAGASLLKKLKAGGSGTGNGSIQVFAASTHTGSK